MKEGNGNRGRRWLLAGLIIPVLFGLVVFFMQHAESSKVGEQKRSLQRAAAEADYQLYQSAMLDGLPAPVARYFRHVLTEGQPFIAAAAMSQGGVLRTAIGNPDWTNFTATQFIAPSAPGFVWDARVAVRPGFHVSVVDSYQRGVGAGRVSLFGALTMVQAEDIAELNAAALHRYLAEAVWYPTALLPQAGVQWTAVDDNTAIASLSDNGNSVSLEFRFNEIGEVTGVYTDGRFGQFDEGYRLTPWQGEFRNYQLVDGMRVPRYGEVGWVIDGELQLVWKGEIEDIRYALVTEQQ